MDCEEVLRRLAAQSEELDRMGVQSLALFGSVARREASAGSDVDLVVEFHGSATLDRYLELESYLEEILGCSVDLITRRSVKPAMRSAIEKDIHYVPGLPALSGGYPQRR